MAQRRAIAEVIIIAVAIAAFIGIMTVLLNLFLYTFADDVASWITKMPRIYQYDYVSPVILLCDTNHIITNEGLSGDAVRKRCSDVCDARNSKIYTYVDGSTASDVSWTPEVSGDKYMCRGPTNHSISIQDSYDNNRAVVSAKTGLDVFGSLENDIASAYIYPSRAAPDPIRETVAELESRAEDRPSRLPFYYMMAGIGFAILALNAMIAILYWVFEDTPLNEQKDSVMKFKKIIYVGIYILIIPIVWDPLAIFMENAGLFIMSPNGMHAGDITAQVVLEAGAFKWPEFNLEKIAGEVFFHPGGPIAGVGDIVNGAVQEIFVNIIMGYARAQATVMTLVTMFITSIVRIEVTMIGIMIYPIVAALSLTPIFKDGGLYEEAKNAIIGGLIAPITGAVIFVTGYFSLEASYAVGTTPIEQWITSLTLLILASTIPTASMRWVAAGATQATSVIGNSIETAMKIGGPVGAAATGMIGSSLVGGKKGEAASKAFASGISGVVGGSLGSSLAGGRGGGAGSGNRGSISAKDASNLGGGNVGQTRPEGKRVALPTQQTYVPGGGDESGTPKQSSKQSSGQSSDQSSGRNAFKNAFLGASGVGILSDGIFGGNSIIKGAPGQMTESYKSGQQEYNQRQAQRQQAMNIQEGLAADRIQNVKAGDNLMYEMSHVQNLDSELAAIDQAKVEAQHAAHKATEAAADAKFKEIHGMPPIKPGDQPSYL